MGTREMGGRERKKGEWKGETGKMQEVVGGRERRRKEVGREGMREAEASGKR